MAFDGGEERASEFIMGVFESLDLALYVCIARK